MTNFLQNFLMAIVFCWLLNQTISNSKDPTPYRPQPIPIERGDFKKLDETMNEGTRLSNITQSKQLPIHLKNSSNSNHIVGSSPTNNPPFVDKQSIKTDFQTRKNNSADIFKASEDISKPIVRSLMVLPGGSNSDLNNRLQSKRNLNFQDFENGLTIDVSFENDEIKNSIEYIIFKMTELTNMMSNCINQEYENNLDVKAIQVKHHCVGLTYQILFFNYREGAVKIKYILIELLKIKLQTLKEDYEDETNFFLDLITNLIDKDYDLIPSLEIAKTSSKYYVSPRYFNNLIELSMPEINAFNEIHQKLKSTRNEIQQILDKKQREDDAGRAIEWVPIDTYIENPEISDPDDKASKIQPQDEVEEDKSEEDELSEQEERPDENEDEIQEEEEENPEDIAQESNDKNQTEEDVEEVNQNELPENSFEEPPVGENTNIDSEELPQGEVPSNQETNSSFLTNSMGGIGDMFGSLENPALSPEQDPNTAQAEPQEIVQQPSVIQNLETEPKLESESSPQEQPTEAPQRRYLSASHANRKDINPQQLSAFRGILNKNSKERSSVYNQSTDLQRSRANQHRQNFFGNKKFTKRNNKRIILL
jgi:hypothetical protein